MGQLKQVMDFDGMPMIRQIADAFLQARLELIVVVGHEQEQVKHALRDLPCQFAFNAQPEDGMFSSVKLGCLIVKPNSPCLMTPCDCPGVQPATIQQICTAMSQHPNQVIIPTFQGRRGHPVGLPARIVEKIRGLPPTTPGVNSLWKQTPELVCHLAVDDSAILHDFDTPADFQKN